MVEKKGLKLGVSYSKLTKVENEIIYLLSKENLTIRQAALRRGTSVQAVYKVLKKLKNNGIVDSKFDVVENIQSTFKPNQIRLHSQEFNIKIIFKDKRYKLIREKANTIDIDGSTIRLYNNSIEIYSNKSFFADTTQKATASSMLYFTRFFKRLEHDLKIIILKSRTQNIKLVNQHYAETNNEIAEECEAKAEKIRVYTNDDGKLWFTIDNSFNMHEAETQHPGTAKQDMNVLQKHFNDIRDNDPPTNTEMMEFILKQQKEFAINIKEHNKLMKNINRAVNKMNKTKKQEEKYKANIQQKNLNKWQ